MHRLLRFTALAAAAASWLFATSVAFAETDSGTVSTYPFSGYWFPHSEGGLTGPLKKYDEVHKTRAAAWEHENHVNRPNIQPWWGNCHAWSAAAVTEKEPRDARAYQSVNFGIGDQKGLLCALHAQDEATSYGDRFGDGRGSDDLQDMTPDEVWRLLQMYVKQRKIPLVFDLDAGDEVWNYPVYQYEVSYQESGDGWVNGTMQIIVADDDVHPDYVGTQPGIYSFTFRCKMAGGSVVAGSGQWTGESEQDHPDFAWYPYVARAENPHVDPDKVSAILGYAVGGGNNPPDDESGEGGETDENTPDENEPDDTPPSDTEPSDTDPSDTPSGNTRPGGSERDDRNGGAGNLPPPPAETGEPSSAPSIDLASVLSPIEWVSLVTNKTSHFPLDAFVDRNDGGKYAPGDPIRVSVESGKAGYLYLFDIDPAGDIHLVYPRAGEPNAIPAGKLIDIPTGDIETWFTAGAPGEHHLRAVVTAKPIVLTGFHQQVGKSKVPKAKPQQNKVSEGAQRGLATQNLRVPPQTKKRVQYRIRNYYGSKSVESKPSPKVDAFAQDDCMFFVVGKGGSPQQDGPQKQNEPQQNGPAQSKP